MAAKRRTYEDYDKDKGRMWKVVKPLLIALAVVAGIALISLALSDAGFFPGNILNRFTVSSFLKETYGGEIVSSEGYDSEKGYFVYRCTVDGQPCEIGAKSFRIRYDGYYHTYCRNTYFESVVTRDLNAFLTQKWADAYSDNTVTWSSTIDIPLSNPDFPSAEGQGGTEEETESVKKALKLYGGSLSFILEIRGENITMDRYKEVVYRAVEMIQQEMDNRPKHMQVYYFRQDAEGDHLQYESTLSGFQFNYNKEGIQKATDLHRYVEIPSELETKVSIYYIVKCVFLIAVSGTVIALSILWIVRKYRKHKRYKSSGT